MKYPSIVSSVKAAIRGIIFTFKHERNFRLEIVFSVFVMLFLFLADASKMDWIMCLVLIIIVLLSELANTALERIVDILKPQKHPYARVVKDIAAGMVLVTIACVSVVGFVVLSPLLYNILNSL